MQEWAGYWSPGHTSHLARLPALSSFPSIPQETGNDLIPVTAFTSALGSDGQGTILAEYIPPLCLGSPSGYGINWCQILEKGVDSS